MGSLKGTIPCSNMIRSTVRTHGVAHRKLDWSIQKIRKREFRGWRTNQILFHEGYANGYKVVKVTGIYTSPINGKVYGKVDDKKVVMDGYAYSMTKKGHTPGRWFYVV